MTDASPSLRVLRTTALSAAMNMAVDEVLLRTGPGPALRIYEWSPAAVSLGYFQKPGDLADLPPELGLVRRLTGGGAILHDQELTLALTTDAELLPRGVARSYDLLHQAVRRALSAVGFEGVRVAECVAGDGCSVAKSPWCFEVPSEPDLITRAGGKIFGSAQRRLRRPHARVLHHGSLILQAHRLTPFCGSVAEQLDPELVREPLAEALVREIGEALQLVPEPGELLPGEMEKAEQLAQRGYAREFTSDGRSDQRRVRSSDRRASRPAR